MKQYLSIPTALLIAVLSHAQTDTQNYIRATVYQVATQNGTTSADTGQPLTADEKTETITYYDGLGRPKQHIAKQAGGDREDLITPVAYDPYGRQAKDYLPYARSSSSLNFESSLLPDGNGNLLPLHSFYQGKFPDDFTGVSTANVNPYSEKLFEASPLNRVMKQGAPGKDWKVNPSGDNDHSIKFGYQTNAANEVKLFRVVFPTQDTEQPQLEYQGYYAPNELYKTITKDENWQPGQTFANDHTTEEFRDKQGRVVLKRTYDNNTAHDTYYVSDDYGNLTYVLSPEGSDTVLDGNNNVQQSVLDKLCYQYRYDHRNRLVEKKVSGKGWEHIVYDQLDRPVLVQDANLRAQGKWLFTKYDVFDRVAYTGMFSYAPTGQEENAARLELAGLVASQASPAWSETRVATAQTINGSTVHYSNAAFPQADIDLLTVNYYDTYSPELTAVAADPGTVLGQSTTTSTRILATGSKVRVLGTNDWIVTVTYYDAKARPIYTASSNGYLDTADITKTQLDFVGKVLKTEGTHTEGPNPAIVVTDVFAYDHAGRLLTQKRQLGSGAQELILKNTYDELGQLVGKAVGGTEAVPLQTVDYRYNIRGWLVQINDPDDLGDDLFGFKIGYNSPVVTGATPLYNGNISETLWKTANTDNGLKSYRYTYDALNRIRTGIDNTDNYSLGSLTDPVVYDRNGNIQSLYRKGHTNEAATTFGVMDHLAYSYDGNQLLSVTDSGDTAYGFKDGNTMGNDYTYDANGNMKTDKNKGITDIVYNHLNLPVHITFYDDDVENPKAGAVDYFYDALGNKLKKLSKYSNMSNGTATYYCGNFVYEQQSSQSNLFLKLITHPEGYAEPDGQGGYGYIYQYKDHLGNIRLSYKSSSPETPSYSADFEGSSFAPWEKSVNTTSVAIVDGRLQVVTGAHLNGVNGYYDLEQGVEYTITLDVDATNFAPNLEFTIFKGSPKKFGEYYIDGNETVSIKFTPDASGEHRINLRLRQSGYSGGDQTFYIDNLYIAPSLEIVEENNYYPFGLEHKGYNNVVNGNEYKYKTYQGQEISEELGYNMLEFKYRHYDVAIGRFVAIDPLAEDYVYNGTYNFAENKVISHLELEGLEGIHSSKVNGAGIRTHVIQKNVVVLTQAPRPINASNSPKRAARIQRQNERITASNIAKVNSVRNELNSNFSNATNTAGETVNFVFNVTALEVENTSGFETRAEQMQVAVIDNGLEGAPSFDGGPNQIAPAAIVTSGNSRNYGNGLQVETDGSTENALSHEVGHTLMTRDQNQEENRPGTGGLMGDPPGHVTSREVDKMLEDAIPALPNVNN